ncbi:conserved hypothetical protein [Burkholderiales bacterium 8X]|nr:conserved hypothetical protein [Burkholderiales bacterium 8X]
MRALLDARLDALRAGNQVERKKAVAGDDAEQSVTQATSASAPAAVAGSPGGASRSPLGECVASLASRESMAVDRSSSGAAHSPVGASPLIAENLAYFKSLWSRLSADRRLGESLAAVPENPGPLNSHRLVHRALASMRELSPAYLGHFMSYVDTLQGLEQMNAAPIERGAVRVAKASGTERRKPMRSKNSKRA